MDEDPRRAAAREHIRSIARRPAAEVERIVSLLQRRSRPEATAPAAREWVRRWGPRRAAMAVATLPACACAEGRCTLCN